LIAAEKRNADESQGRVNFGLAVRWRIAILLCLITTVNYIDRQAFAVAGPVIAEEFALSNTEFGFIVSAFLFAYAIGQLIVGPVIDRLGTKRAFSLAVVAWSLAGMLCAAGRGFWSFLTYRSLLGAAEAANFPAALKSIAEWFPDADRSLAVGIVTIGPGLGAIISPPLLGFLIVTLGWPWAFILPGAAGFVWLWIWQIYYHAPEQHPTLSPTERGLIMRDREPFEAGADNRRWFDVVRFFRYREVWGLMLSRFVNDGAFYFYVSWLPLYLAQERGFDIRQIAMFAWIPFLAADRGSLSGGWLGRRFIQNGMSLDRSRKILIWGGAVLVLLTLPAATVDSPYTALGLIGVAMFAIQGKAANLFALPADLFPPREVGTIWGLFGAVGSFGGMVFNVAVGWVTDEFSYAPVFLAVGITQILSALFVTWLIPRICRIT
jgi:ACS family hexuronate transporter-like MFS transporter